MPELNLIDQHGQQKDDGNRMALLATDCKQFSIDGPPELVVGEYVSLLFIQQRISDIVPPREGGVTIGQDDL
jgi:hypothetical protein